MSIIQSLTHSQSRKLGLALPVEETLFPLFGIREGPPMKFIIPPDPTEPEGCIGNPRQVKYVWVPSTYKVRPAPGDDPKSALSGATVVSISNPDKTGEELAQAEADLRCNKIPGVSHKPFSNTLAACVVNNDEMKLRDEARPTTYVALPTVYTTPLGRSFIINCEGGISKAGGYCTVTYHFCTTLDIYYRFLPRIEHWDLRLDEVVYFDRGVHESLEAALVKNFSWPN
jgi:hypothetical protein